MSTYETFGATVDEEDSDSIGSLELDKNKKGTRLQHCLYTFIRAICSRNFIRALIYGQLLSILQCGTGIFSGLLQNEDVSTPTAQSFGMYCVLCLVFSTQLAYKQDGRNLLSILKSFDGLKYALIGLIDVEANFLVVKAYQYTTVTSVQILDCFSIAAVLVLSRIFLRTHYRVTHYVGVAISVLGLGGLVGSDVITGNSESGDGSNIALGDVLVISGAVLYGVSNVAQEFVVKSYGRREFLGMLGIFSTVISGIQVIFLERQELFKVDFTCYKVVLPWLAFVIFLFLMYACMSHVIQKTSATVTNISILSADFYSLILGIFIFQYEFHFLYLVAFVVVILGVAVYSVRPTAVPESIPVNSQDEEARR
uniref:EamA domain-containing protein n=1 Tax=Arion vulgaris TaxID=1028688 RepID=A0A0B7AKR9_9EUPU